MSQTIYDTTPMRQVFKEGTWDVKLSFLVMGLANLVNKQFTKGLLFLLSEIAFLVAFVIQIIPALKGMITFPEFTPGHDWYTYVFKVTGFEGELISDEESREGTLEWVPYDEVLSKPTWEGDHTFVEWLLEDKPFFSAKFVYDGDKLLDTQVDFYE